jgi:hypothetical protein
MPGGTSPWTIFTDEAWHKDVPLLIITMKNLISASVGVGLIAIGLLVQVVGADRIGFILESLGNRLAEPDSMP